MASKRSGKRSRSRSAEFVQNPRGLIHPRVQKVGPEHFGIVSIDCAKVRSKWMLADFYGNICVPPTEVAHNRVELDAAVASVRAGLARQGMQDCLVAIERTGRYHHPCKNTFANAGFETRLVHPFTTKQFRQADYADIKTDDIDLAAIHRAAVNGFALLEAAPSEFWRQLLLFIRHRRDLVHKSSALCCQIREHLDAALPGYAWAQTAAAPDVAAAFHRQIALAYEDDRFRKSQEISTLERTIAQLLCRTPYVLLLSIPGINVVSAADFAGEMGPIANYANHRAITGRAGLFPARYQSDRVDHSHALVRRANRSLRTPSLALQTTSCAATPISAASPHVGGSPKRIHA